MWRRDASRRPVVLQDLGLGARTTEGLATGDSQLAKVGYRSAAVVEQVYRKRAMRRFATALAKQRWLRPLTRFLARNRSH